MPKLIPESAALPILTLEQAADLLARLQTDPALSTAPAAIVFVINLPPKQESDHTDLPSTAIQLETNAGCCSPQALTNLGLVAYDHRPALRTFYIIGCAYREGKTSLRKVAEELERRDLAGTLPPKIGTSVTHLSATIQKLERDVFAAFFRDPMVRLRQTPDGEGTSGVLSERGQQAWEATRQFLIDCSDLPEW